MRLQRAGIAVAEAAQMNLPPFIPDLAAEGLPNKFHAKRTTCNHGHTHASKREAKRCDELHLLERAGQITMLRVEPQFWFTLNGQQIKHENGRRVGYKPDFAYTELPGLHDVVEDIKSKATMTEAAVLRMALFRALFPDVELRVVR